jgi:TolB-like protein/DNA-binding SARP family transcriptional activator
MCERGSGMDAVPPAKFRLSLLGRFELTGPDGPVDLPNKKLAGLLAYLACSAPVPQPREKLATLLWGSHFEAQARQNLRQALFRLRRTLGQDALIGDDEEISLCPGAIDCDAARFEALIGEGSSTSLASAIDLYKGILLADVTVTEEAWSDWLAGERQRLENLALDAMNRHAEQELQSGNAESALKVANQAIAVNALREDAHRLVIRALAANGRRADALKHYDRLAELLERELDVGPDPITQTLVAGLRKSLAAGVAEPPSDVTPPLPLPDRPSIAVLPFANMSGDPEQEYFADGVVEDILTALSRIRWLFVIARQSSFSYKGRAVDVKQIGRELGVRYVVEGSVRKSGNRVRLTAQLIDVGTNAHIWADRYERELSDIFALQDEITQQIVVAIEPNVRDVEIKRARAKPTESLTAYDLYLRALPHLHAQNEGGAKRAEVLLHQAIELDPEYPEALGALTDSITHRALNGWHESVTRGRDEACGFARRALVAGPDNSTCVASAAFAYAALGRRYEEAVDLADRAIQLHPNSTFVRNRAGSVYVNSGESDKAIAQFEAAQRMNPRDPKSLSFALSGTTAAHFFARRFEDCVHSGRRVLASLPASNLARRHVAAALAHLGRIDEAQAEIATLLSHQPNSSLARSRLSSFRHDWMYELYVDGLRKAGLPE